MNGRLSIGYFGDGKWAHEALKLMIQDDTLEVKFICGRYSSLDYVMQKMANQYGIGFYTHPNVNSQEFMDLVSQYKCDLFVSMSFDQIFTRKIIDMARLKIINCHAGKLPFYRGRSVLNWVLINDEKEFGITVHFVDEGIDTGDIILQSTYPITDEDDYGSLLNRAYVECARLLYNGIKLVQNGNYRLIKQSDIHPIGSYYKRRKPGDEIIDWNKTSRELFNFIRALSKPGPVARSHINGQDIKINKAKIIIDPIMYKGIIGQVVGKSDTGLIIKTKDSAIEITEFDYKGKIKIGDKLG